MEETLVAMRQQEETAVQENVDLIVEAIKVMEDKVNAQLEIAKSIVPEKGDKGDKGKDGKDGKSGLDGKNGKDGLNGKDGADGKDGVSVTDAKIDFDGSLVITLSTGQEINVGEVVAPELQEKIKLVTSGGAGTVLPSQTGNANKYLKTDGSVLSWSTVSGGGSGTVTSVGTSGTVNGITLTGGPITSSGTVTLGGILDLSSPPAIGGTTASTGRFTTVTSTIATGTAPFTVASTTQVANLNAATAGSSATLTTPRAIYGNNFDGSAALTGIIASTYGGTGNGFTKFSGATTAEKTYTLPDATTTILTTNAAVTIGQGGTGQTSKTNAFDALSPTTTKGDLIVSDGTNNIRIAVGTDAYVLTADSTTASGIKWAASSGGGGGLTQAQALKLVSLRL
jgi:hypothetical protein